MPPDESHLDPELIIKNKHIALSLLLMVKHNLARYEQPAKWYSESNMPFDESPSHTPGDPSITPPDEDPVDLGLQLPDVTEDDRNAAFVRLSRCWRLSIPETLDALEVEASEAGLLHSNLAAPSTTATPPQPPKYSVDLDFLPSRLMFHCSAE